MNGKKRARWHVTDRQCSTNSYLQWRFHQLSRQLQRLQSLLQMAFLMKMSVVFTDVAFHPRLETCKHTKPFYYFCHKMGHLVRFRYTKKRLPYKPFHHTRSTDSREDERTETIFQAKASDRSHHPPFTVTLKADGVPITFEIYTRSAITLIKERALCSLNLSMLTIRRHWMISQETPPQSILIEDY